jgi:hypothetical protein
MVPVIRLICVSATPNTLLFLNYSEASQTLLIELSEFFMVSCSLYLPASTSCVCIHMDSWSLCDSEIFLWCFQKMRELRIIVFIAAYMLLNCVCIHSYWLLMPHCI